MNVSEKTEGINYEAEYNRMKKEMEKIKEENAYLREEMKNKEKELRYYYGFEAACKLIFGRRYENGC